MTDPVLVAQSAIPFIALLNDDASASPYEVVDETIVLNAGLRCVYPTSWVLLKGNKFPLDWWRVDWRTRYIGKVYHERCPLVPPPTPRLVLRPVAHYEPGELLP